LSRTATVCAAWLSRKAAQRCRLLSDTPGAGKPHPDFRLAPDVPRD
jgi:hypothetical protein